MAAPAFGKREQNEEAKASCIDECGSLNSGSAMSHELDALKPVSDLQEPRAETSDYYLTSNFE